VVRLRVDPPGHPSREPKKASSAVLAAPGPPPPPPGAPPAHLSGHGLPPDPVPPQFDLRAFSENESTAPAALAEMEAYRDPPARSGGVLWVVFGTAAALVLVGVGVAAMMWG
jgi:hypothetical protein